MATPVSEKEFLDSDDHLINFFGIIFLFLILVSGVIAYLSSSTDIFVNQELKLFLLKALLGMGTLMIIVIYSNFKALDILQDHALLLFKIVLYSIVIAISAVLFSFTAFLFFAVLTSTNELTALIIPFLSLGFSLGITVLLVFLVKHLIKARFTLVAKWVRIGTSIVLNEPGMIAIAIIQSIISSVVGLVITIAAFLYKNGAVSDEQAYVLLGVLLLFTYLSFVILYYFDGANIYVAYQRIKNRDPTVRQGFRASWKQLPSIMLYAVISALTMLLLKPYSWLRRSPGRSAASSETHVSSSNDDSIVGFLFSLVFGLVLFGVFVALETLYYFVSFFTLPTIVIRKKNAIDAMKESFKLFRKNAWDIIFMNFGLGWSNFLVYMFTALISGGLGFVYGYVVFGSTGWAIAFAVIALILSVWVTRFVLRPLYLSMTTILYVEATEGVAGLKMVPNDLKKEISRLLDRYPYSRFPTRRR